MVRDKQKKTHWRGHADEQAAGNSLETRQDTFLRHTNNTLAVHLIPRPPSLPLLLPSASTFTTTSSSLTSRPPTPLKAAAATEAAEEPPVVITR
ncbi:hypothetical protein E2C01_071824 [Portunus trituberculatus]|uniref:Uncharacterized protein n=1 Tax=Portunus trituberculatus TaxID=210409 RepID=A0A5B7I0X6_PORTR|nr:hypothetical protein [Portunus trituberculatus]